MSALIIISVLTFITYLLTRKISIVIKKDEHWRVEVHFTLGALRIKKNVTKQSENKKTDGERKKSDAHHYREIFHRLMKIFAHSEIRIRKLYIPCTADEDDLPSKDATRPWRYHSVIFALLAFLRANSKKLTIDDNAIILNSDTPKLSVDLNVKVRLFRVIGTVAVFIFSENVMKRKKTA